MPPKIRSKLSRRIINKKNVLKKHHNMIQKIIISRPIIKRKPRSIPAKPIQYPVPRYSPKTRY